jgi:hypothetical protein
VRRQLVEGQCVGCSGDERLGLGHWRSLFTSASRN